MSEDCSAYMDRCCRQSSTTTREQRISLAISIHNNYHTFKDNETYQPQNRTRRRHCQQGRPRKVKPAHRVKDASPRALQPNIVRDHHRRHGHAQQQRRDLDAKLPSPAERFGHGAAEGSSEGGAGAEVCGDVGLVGASASDDK